ncbi:hypothetical protein E0Y62_26370 [Cytobacillus praedii]|uniref:PD(D/E)XK endonuclease domain-containing protein n=2 Tax=Cytobacillus praedii TaxID=1742358 RepID=A0A4R1AMX8_9BACI|nr:hypothetical protein E0Y62_26370 [Cytobacillus praedii]
MTTHQVSVSAESYTATLFAWAGYDVSVQYGANQPEYDLVVTRGDQFLKVSVKGSQDGGWILASKYLQNGDYHGAIDLWLKNHTNKTIFSLVQLESVDFQSIFPRVYLATPIEIAEHLKNVRGGCGLTNLKEKHEWKNGVAKGTVDAVPDHWRFSKERIEVLMKV